MFSNYFLTNCNGKQCINLHDKDKANIYFVLSNSHDVNKKIMVNLLNFCYVNFYFFIIANNSKIQIDLHVNHYKNNSTSNIFVKSLVTNSSNVSINCVSWAKTKTCKNIINQQIDGLIFDKSSKMTVLPSLDICSNNLIAKHTVNIGQINPEIIFYLNTKGLNNYQIYKFLINNFIRDIQPFLTKYKKDISNDIKKVLGDKNE